MLEWLSGISIIYWVGVLNRIITIWRLSYCHFCINSVKLKKKMQFNYNYNMKVIVKIEGYHVQNKLQTAYQTVTQFN